MPQTRLVQYRKSAITPDLAEAMRRLEARAAEERNEAGEPTLRLVYDARSPSDMSWDSIRGFPGPTHCAPPWSMVPAGREVYLGIEFLNDTGPETTVRERALATLWGLAVPLGFTPWQRHPTPGPTDDVFHFLGPWHSVYDHLCGEGRGEQGWPSMACAAQLDVGAWESNRPTERTIQAHLHRLGRNPGTLDGVIGGRTQAELRGVGLQGVPLKRAAEQIVARTTTRVQQARTHGQVLIPDQPFNVAAFGEISTTRTANGIALTINGPGRVVVDVRSQS